MLHAAWYWPWLEDDAFISLRYADNLARGRGLVFNPGERVEGFSNPSWVLAAAALLRLGADPLLWLRLLGIAAGALCLPLAWRLARAAAAPPSAWALLAPLFLAICPVLPRHSVSGLESSLFAALLAGGLLLALRPPGRERPALLAAVLVLLGATRPEGPALALALALLPHARDRWGQAPAPAGGGGEADGGAARRPSAWPLLAVLGALAIGTVWRWSYYGSLLPNTYQAKMTGTTGAVVDGLQYTLRFLRNSGGGLLLGLGLVPLLGSRRLDRPQAMALLAAAYGSFVVVAGGDWMRHFRLYAHVLPVAAALMGAGAATVAGFAAGRGPLGRRVGALLAATAAVGALTVADHEQQVNAQFRPSLREGTYLVQRYADLGRWLAANTPADASVAISDIGAAGYYSDRRIIDMFGLVDPHIARRPGKPHHKLDARYVLSLEPDYVVLVESRYEAGRFWRLPDTALYRLAGFREGYEQVHQLDMQDDFIKVFRRLPPRAPAELD